MSHQDESILAMLAMREGQSRPEASLVTPEEYAILAMTRNLWNAFLALPTMNPSDAEETRRDIHDIQNRILARATERTLVSLENSAEIARYKVK